MAKRIKVYKVAKVKVNTIAGRKAILKNLETKQNISKANRLQIDLLKELEKEKQRLLKLSKAPINKQKYSKGKRKKQEKYREKQAEKAKLVEIQIKKEFNKLLGLDNKNKQDKSKRSLISVSSKGEVQVEKISYKKIDQFIEDAATETKASGKCISTFEDFLTALYNKYITSDVFSEWNVIQYINSFITGTSHAWARRFMNHLNICPEISREEFYGWLETAYMMGLL